MAENVTIPRDLARAIAKAKEVDTLDDADRLLAFRETTRGKPDLRRVAQSAVASVSGLAAGTVPVGVQDVRSHGSFLVTNTAAVNAATLQAACTHMDSIGGGTIQLPIGAYACDEVNPGDKTTIQGFGIGVTTLLVGRNQRCFDQTDNTNRASITLRDMTIKGPWTTYQSQSTTDAGAPFDYLVVLKNYARVIVRNVEIREGRYMGLFIINASYATVRDCIVEECAKDAIHFDDCSNVFAINNKITHCGDDGIAVLRKTDQAYSEAAIIMGNILEDTYGIKIIGCRQTIISNNITRRCKGYGAWVGGDDGSGAQGRNDAADVIIVGNQFLDTLNKSVFTSGDLSTGILIDAPPMTVVSGSVQPGAFDYTLHAFQKPEATYLGSAVTGAPVGGFWRVHVAENIIAKTLPDVAAYSLWGFGQAYKNSGYFDPAISSHIFASGRAVQLNGHAYFHTTISRNKIHGWMEGVSYQEASSQDNAPRHMEIGHNEFWRIKSFCVGFGNPNFFETNLYWNVVDIRVLGNKFDMDPYFESPNRTGGATPDGTWTAANFLPAAIYAPSMRGLHIDGNSFRNLFTPLYRVGGSAATAYTWGPSNVLIGEMDGHGLGADGASGVTLNGHACLWRVEDSNPQSNTYGYSLSEQQTLGYSSSAPTTGHYFRGQRLTRTDATASAAPGQVCTQSGSRSSAAWASGATLAVGSWRYASNNHVYSLITAGGGTTANEPTHTYGRVTGADGYVWQHQASARCLLAAQAALGAAS